ncbi:MAG TPA: polyprenyl synthetase family protein [Clostridiaceae bacterium]|nr:polyprenyl synthetase family protein [Clostridiaceae bacterium]
MWSKYPVINEELAAFEEYLETALESRNKFLANASRDAVLSGGKRLRPAFTILAALHGVYDREKVFPAAASVEVLHAATLVHDDIIDNAKTRRGKITLSEKHNTNLAVYTGDYLLTKSLKLLIKTGLKPEKLNVLARAITLLCEAEVEQYLSKYTVSSVYNYLKRILGKTGVLFSASLVLGAKTANLSDDITRQFGRFGLSFGAAFQIRDDLLDILSDSTKEGKPVLNDLKEGIATLPVIMAARNNPGLLKEVNEFFNGNGDINSILNSIKTSGGVEGTKKLKDRYKEKCRQFIEKIPHTPYTDAMSEIVNWL